MQRAIAAATVCLMTVLASPAEASPCDFVLSWTRETISDCIKHLQHEIEMSQLQTQTLEAENRILRGNLCLLVSEIRSSNTSSTLATIEDLACEELRARAMKKHQLKKKAP